MNKNRDLIEPKTTEDAVLAKLSAAKTRQRVKTCPDRNPYFNRKDLEHADSVEAAADAVLKLPEIPAIGIGGELAPAMGGPNMGLAVIYKEPDRVSLDASMARAQQADDNGVLIEALDAAESMKAEDAAEKMLCHQLPALHRAAFEMLKKAGNTGDVDRACKLANTAARLMDTFQRGMVSLKTYRRGGTQVIRHVHQYVQVNEGGKAVVTGGASAGGEVEE